MSREDAVWAVARMKHGSEPWPEGGCVQCLADAANDVAAAEPHLRALIAAEIRALRVTDHMSDVYRMGWNDAQDDAARIAEGTP